MSLPVSGPNSSKPTTGQTVAGVYNATPPVLEDGQACPIQVDVNGQIKTSGGGGGGDVNITGVNGTPPALNNPLPVELSDGTNAVGTAGNPLSVNVITGGGSNASVGATGAPAPASATYMGVNKAGNLVAPLADTAGNLQTVVSEALPAGTNVIGHVIADSGSTTAVTGNVTVVQPTGTNLHTVVDSGSITATQATGTNLHTVVDSGTITAVTSITNQVDENLKQVGGANTATSASGVQKVGIVGGAAGVTLDAVLGATKPANVLQVGGNDGTNAFALPLVSGGAAVQDNVSQWGAAAVAAAANTAGDGTQVVPTIRSSDRKYSQILTTTPLGANAVFTSSWFDTNQTSGVQVFLSFIADHSNTTGSPLLIQGTDDTSNGSMTVGLATFAVSGGNVQTAGPVFISTRYWRVVYTNNAVIQSSFELTATEVTGLTSVPLIGTNAATGAKTTIATSTSGVLSLLTSSSFNENIAASVLPNAIAASSVLPSGQFAATGSPNAAATVFVAVRIPTVWRGSQFSAAGTNVLWTPPSAKKARLMRYKIEVGEDATISGGPLPINVAFTEVLGTATGATLAYPGFGFTHRLVVPAAVLATSFNGYDSGWIDLGNGQITTTAALASAAAPVAALGMGIMVPQPVTTNVNPTWTSASVTWEAATTGFKTNGSLGNFKLVQQANAVASATSAAIAAAQHVTGNAVFVFWRATVAGGAPTMTVTDTAGNTYTNAAQVTTGNDYIGMAYSLNIKGNAANVVTATTTTHTSSQIEIIVIEYAGLGSAGVGGTAQVGTTGTSTAPASGNYSPAEAGDLIFSYFGSSATVTNQPTIGSNFRLVGTLFNATQGSLCVADNFGNGSLTAGVVNVMTAGTEE